ncbi:M15 family metallopeptidase [Leuconostoc citreum]
MKAFTNTTEWDWLAVKNIPIKPLEEDLVPINFFPEKIQISPQYFLQKLPGAIPELYLRQGVYEKLITASNDLPSGYKFLIYDAWRDIKTQQALFDILYERHRQQNPNMTVNELQQLTLKIVALPSTNLLKPSPHNTGGSVDLTIIDSVGRLLNMGTPFDEASIRAQTTYFDDPLNVIRKNRQLLYNIMTRHGFTNYSEEWWHYDYGNQNWAWVSGQSYAVYIGTSPQFAWHSPF